MKQLVMKSERKIHEELDLAKQEDFVFDFFYNDVTGTVECRSNGRSYKHEDIITEQVIACTDGNIHKITADNIKGTLVFVQDRTYSG